MTAAGVAQRTIYRDDEWPACVKSLRPGDRLVLGGGLRVLGDNREEIADRVAEVRGRKAVVMDAETGRTAADDGAELMSEAIARLRGEKIMPDAERARDMQRASTRAKVKGRMPKREALAIWRDVSKTVPEALKLMRDWTQASAYREFGPRGIPAGPRPGKNR